MCKDCKYDFVGVTLDPDYPIIPVTELPTEPATPPANMEGNDVSPCPACAH